MSVIGLEHSKNNPMLKFTKSLACFAILLSSLTSNAKQPERGYRGFIEWSNDYRSEQGFITRINNYFTGATTSHGYQINSTFFVGAGVGVERCTKFDDWIAPVFVQGRADLLFGKFTPFADMRLGYQFGQGGGIYFSPAVGYRFNWGRKVGINLGIGMTLAAYKREIYDITVVPGEIFDIKYVGTEHPLKPYFSFRVGFDF